MAASSSYNDSVFINCPFDDEYKRFFDAMVFVTHDCGFIARCAREVDDAGQIRIDKIVTIIRDCKLGIHDISRTELDHEHALPRFNMPLELGLFMGAKRFGQGKQKEKLCLILDKDRYRYQKFCSDIAGQDIHTHQGEIGPLIRVVRNWLRNACTDPDIKIPGASHIIARYEKFREYLPMLCEKLRLDLDELVFNDYTTLVSEWLKEHSNWGRA